MRLKRFFLIAITTPLLTVSPPFWLNFPVTSSVLPVVAQASDTRQAEADRLFRQGKQQYDKGEFQSAIQSFQQALTIYREIGNLFEEIETLINLGIAYTTLGNCTKTVEYYEQYLTITSNNSISSTQELTSEDYEDYENYWSRYWFKYRLVPTQALLLGRVDARAEAERLWQQGLQLLEAGEQQAAKQSFQQADIYREIVNLSEKRVEAKRLLQQGEELYQTQQFDVAIQPLQQALEIYRRIGDYQGLVQALINHGNAYLAMEEYAIASSSFRHALAISKEIKDRQNEENIQQRLTVAQNKINNLKVRADLLYKQGIEHYQACQSQAAFHSWQQAEQIYFKIDSDAIDYGINSYPDDAAIGFPRKILLATVERLYNRGIQQYKIHQDEEALQSWYQALIICQQYKRECPAQIESDMLEKLGLVYDALGQHQEAIKFYQQQLEIYQQERMLGSIDDGQAISLYYLGLALLKSGKLKEAEPFLRQNIQLLEKRRRSGQSIMISEYSDDDLVSFFDKEQYRAYPILQQALIAQNKHKAALEIAEQGRNRIFLDRLVRALEPDPVYPAIYVLPWRIAPFISRLPHSEPPTTELPSVQQIQQIAQVQKATLVEYSIVGSALYIWVIKPTGEITFRQADLSSLDIPLKDLVIETRDSIGISRSIFKAEVVNSTDEENQTKRLQQLHQLLIEPIADLLPADPEERIIFIPQGELFLVPFAALKDQEGRYLIEKHTILTAPSIQVLQFTRQQRQRSRGAGGHRRTGAEALVVGNPTMPNAQPQMGEKPQQLADLPGAKREAEAIAPLFNTTPLTGNAATETAVKAKLPQARIIHLATHGLFDDIQGLQSAIALAPTDTDNGLLTAQEILNLKLNAELVVLSACDTGRGRITGDGVIGLSRSLIAAGTPSVIVSLWAVPDNPTQELMTEFYHQLKLTGDKARALRIAMLKMKEQYPDTPKKWAAFTLIGEAE